MRASSTAIWPVSYTHLFTVIPSAEGKDTGLLTSLGHTLTDDWKVNEDYNNEKAGEYTITLVKDCLLYTSHRGL